MRVKVFLRVFFAGRLRRIGEKPGGSTVDSSLDRPSSPNCVYSPDVRNSVVPNRSRSRPALVDDATWARLPVAGCSKAAGRARGEQVEGVEHEHEYEHEHDDLGPEHFDRLDKTKSVARLVRCLKQLGCEVEIKHAA